MTIDEIYYSCEIDKPALVAQYTQRDCIVYDSRFDPDQSWGFLDGGVEAALGGPIISALDLSVCSYRFGS